MTRNNLACLAISIGTLGLLNAFSLPATAEELINNRGIKFDRDTVIEFEFIESHGAYQSTFGVIDLDSCQIDTSGIVQFDTCTKTPLLKEVKSADTYETIFRPSDYQTDLTHNNRNNDFLGTPGNAVPEPMAEFLFEAKRKYAFYLESYYDGHPRPASVVYTTDFFNSHGNRQALFHKEGLTKEEIAQRRVSRSSDENFFPSLVDGGVLLYFDDTGKTMVRESLQDSDFDDFVVGVGGGYECVDPNSNEPEVSMTDVDVQ